MQARHSFVSVGRPLSLKMDAYCIPCPGAIKQHRRAGYGDVHAEINSLIASVRGAPSDPRLPEATRLDIVKRHAEHRIAVKHGGNERQTMLEYVVTLICVPCLVWTRHCICECCQACPDLLCLVPRPVASVKLTSCLCKANGAQLQRSSNLFVAQALGPDALFVIKCWGSKCCSCTRGISVL